MSDKIQEPTLNNELLEKLEEFIRKYYKNRILQGGIFFVGGFVSFFLLVSLLEYFGHFGSGVRAVMFYSFVLFTLIILYRFILLPLFSLYRIGKRLDYNTASRIIGTHFESIQDKLLNTLQLNQQYQSSFDNIFLAASINQKIVELRPIRFSKAVDFAKNKRYLKYAIGPLAILLVIMIVAPGFKETTTRIIQYDKHFAVPAPFEFVLQNTSLEASQNDDYEVKLEIKGKVMPEEVYLVSSGNRFKMKKNGLADFTYTLKNLQRSVEFHFESNGFSSDAYQLEVKQKPVLLDFSIFLDYPLYTGKTDEKMDNIGDLTVPAGTRIQWKFNTKNVDKIKLFTAGTYAEATKDGDNRFNYSKVFKTGETIKIATSNPETESKDSVIYRINVIPDAYPQITFKEKADSNNSKLIYFVGDITDDYGLTKLVFHYKFIETENPAKKQQPLTAKSIAINQHQNAQNFFYRWDVGELNIQAGEKIEYYFEVWDNDAVNGNKATRTSNGIFAAPTLEQIEKQTEKSNDAIKDEMAESIKETKALEEEIKKMEQKLTEKRSLNWEEKKQLKDLIEKHQNLQEKMKDLMNQNKEKDQKESEYKQQNQEILEKQAELQKLMDELMDDEMKQLLQKMQELLEKNNKDELQEQMDKFKFNDKELKKKMERALELFKQLELEKKMQETIDKLAELAKEQEKLAEDTKNNKEKSEELEKKQDELNKKFEDIKKDLNEIKEKNEKLEQPNDLKDTKNKEDGIEKEQKDSKKELQNKQNNKAAPHQKKAAEEMKEMSEEMQSDMSEMQAEKKEEDYNTLRQILENLVTVSKDQEKLMKDFKTVGGYNPKFVELAQQQKKLRDDTKIIEDSLFALSKRVVQIQSFINKEIGLVNNNMDKALDNLGYRNIPALVSNQQYIMTSLNNLALMLSEVLKNMQEDMKNAKPNPNCKNPKSGKKGKPSMKEMKEMQEKMNKEMEGMQKDGKRMTSKQMAEMAAKQAALRKKMRDMQQQLEKEGNGKKLGDLQKTQDMMDEVEKDIVNKRITEETLRRQREILTRLLDHERAEKEQEQDEERKSNEGKEVRRDLPPSLQEYLKQQQKGQELLRSVSPSLNPYYKEKVKEYFKAIEN